MELRTETNGLKRQSEAVERQAKCDNIRIVGRSKSASECFPTMVANMLKEVLGLEKLSLIDFVYRTSARKSSDG